MNLKRIHIQAFRSLYDIEFAPGQFTVLAGPNNAGKSTLAQALKFLGEAHRLGLEFAVNRSGGYENIAFRRVRRTKHPIVFDVEAAFSYQSVPTLSRELRGRASRLNPQMFRAQYGIARSEFDAEITVNHRFELKAEGERIEADFSVLAEHFDASAYQFHDDSRRELFDIAREGELLAVPEVERDTPRDIVWDRAVAPFLVKDESLVPLFSENLLPTTLLTSVFGFNILIRHYTQLLGGTQLFQLVPLECRLPGSPTPNAQLGTHGANLPALVAHMTRHFPSEWGNTLMAMRQIVPGLEDIRTTFTPDRRLTIQFVEAGRGRPWSPQEVSDGTIQSLALFLTLFDPRQQLVVIEEPENSLHPWIVRSFVDACRAATDKQIILTTHSPALLSYLNPEEVTLVWRREGESHVKPLLALDPDARRLWEEGSSSVFDILDGGFMSESVPEGYA